MSPVFPVTTIGDAPRAFQPIAIGADGEKSQWVVPEEMPVAFVFNRRNYAVMLATPLDLIDFAAGFTLTEKIVDDASEIENLDIVYSDRGVDLRIKLSPTKLERFDVRQRRRNLPGVAGCGACGLENADEFFEPLAPVAGEKARIATTAIGKAFAALSDHQPLNTKTRSVHAAAWVAEDGSILHAREDVGRHNALDKLLGALALVDTDMNSGFVLVSSRCSYELVEKAARRGVRAMASMSGPTTFAIQKAREANMALYARSPTGVVEVIGDDVQPDTPR